jgi:periplasmic copper chaperone A
MSILSTFTLVRPTLLWRRSGQNALRLIVGLMLVAQAHAHEFTAGDLELIHPNIPAPAASAKAVGGYLGIANSGTEPDRLIGVEVPSVMRAEIHTTQHSADGIAKMMQLEGIDIPAGETVMLERGGMHIMLMGLKAPLTEGQMVPATLIFERAGRVEIEFMIDPANHDNHSAMGH